MSEVLLICGAGMSSSVMAKKVTEYLHHQNFDINVTARGEYEGEHLIKQAKYDFYLVSPQIKMYFKKFERHAQEVGKKVVQVPNDAYAPLPWSIEKMAKLILEGVSEDNK